MALPLNEAIQRAFDRCNLEGEDTDIWNMMFKYKAIRDLPEEEQEEIYNDIAFGLGFMR